MQLDPDICYRAILARDARFDGRFFTGVHTTGIYCRPICSATAPRRDHVSFHPSAAAAQAAGFRPCLRCRPETTPDIAAWNGTKNTVSRAMTLIAEGALNDRGIDALADRLGLGARQLRRLFQTHLGAAPLAIANARRIDLAKQLITETALPLSDVALAAGFRSIRRFNASFQAIYRQTPSSLRRPNPARPATNPARHAAPDSPGLTLILPYKPPYDWDALLRHFANRAIIGVESVTTTHYARTITLPTMKDAIGTISVTRAPKRHALSATIRFPVIAALPGIVERLRRLFDLGADPALIDAHLARDPLLAPSIAAHPGLRVPGAWDGFEMALRAILHQHVSVAAAVRLITRLVDHFGAAIPLDIRSHSHPALTHRFPTPSDIAGTTPAILATLLAIPIRRAASITRLAHTALHQPSWFAPGPPLDHAISTLTTLPGIGPWTAQIIALRALHEPDAFPNTDLVLRRALNQNRDMLDNPGPSSTTHDARTESWRPWRAYAAQHLWTRN